MKILLINNFFPPYARGGAERVVESLAERLVREGDEVIVATLQTHNRQRTTDNAQPTTEKVLNCTIYRIIHSNLHHPANDYKHSWLIRLVWWLVMIFNPLVTRSIKKIIETEKPDLVWTHNLYGLSFLIPRMIQKMGLKHRHTVHDIQLAYPSGVLIKGEEGKWINMFFLRRWYEKLTKRLFASPNEVIFPSKWLKGFYEERGFFQYSQRIVEANNQLPEFRIRNYELRIKGKEKNIFRLLYVGQIEKHKGILFLIKSLPQYVIRNTLYELNIVGTGSALEEARQLVRGSKHIFFHDRVPHEELEKYYDAADVVAVPSLCYENAPTVIYESLQRGVPVLASRIGGIPELVREGENGWLFEAGDERDFIEQLSDVVVGFFAPPRVGSSLQLEP